MDEPRRSFDVEREKGDRARRPAFSLHASGCVRSTCLRVELRVLGKNRLLESLERLARLDAERLDECRARGSVGLERFRLAVTPVQREHQQTAQALAQRLSGDERLQLSDDVLVQAQCDVRLDPLFERIEPQLLESADLGLCPRFVLDVCEGPAAPQSEGGSEGVCCVARLLATRLVEQSLEFRGVGVGCTQEVAGPPRGYRVRR